MASAKRPLGLLAVLNALVVHTCCVGHTAAAAGDQHPASDLLVATLVVVAAVAPHRCATTRAVVDSKPMQRDAMMTALCYQLFVYYISCENSSHFVNFDKGLVSSLSEFVLQMCTKPKVTLLLAIHLLPTQPRRHHCTKHSNTA